ncbi:MULTISPECIES: thioredoxin domain-containing protein [Vibrio harveyi group]|uniref:thioredoxin domain-containing protein n=1 Tax=Vibrio harveyi group TaxID=717610 RepID=UPI001F0803C2|nr:MULTISPECIES: thioredoxin domain-containing protein [Vibrio harveyi group]MEA5376655.1 thioredoxin domain-containing protein [Vibrio parahaemolyticus]UMM06730.1 DsbA family protein [Vibrio campbellii]
MKTPLRKAYTLWIRSLIVVVAGLSSLSAAASDEIALGSAQAPVTLIEYGSLTCDYCINFHREVLPLIQSRHIDTGRVRFIYRDFPTSAAATRGAVAARCAGDQYYRMLDVLFAEVGRWATADDVDAALTQQAASLRMNEKRFRTCLNDPSHSLAVIEGQQQAKTEFDVLGTPTFLINGKIVRGKRTIEEMEALIKKALPDPPQPATDQTK